MKLSELERKLAEYRNCGFGDDAIVYVHIDPTQNAPGFYGGKLLTDTNLFSSAEKLADIAKKHADLMAECHEALADSRSMRNRTGLDL